MANAQSNRVTIRKSHQRKLPLVTRLENRGGNTTALDTRVDTHGVTSGNSWSYLGKLDDIEHNLNRQAPWVEKKIQRQLSTLPYISVFQIQPTTRESHPYRAFRRVLSETTALDTDGERVQTELPAIGNQQFRDLKTARHATGRAQLLAPLVIPRSLLRLPPAPQSLTACRAPHPTDRSC